MGNIFFDELSLRVDKLLFVVLKVKIYFIIKIMFIYYYVINGRLGIIYFL